MLSSPLPSFQIFSTRDHSIDQRSGPSAVRFDLQAPSSPSSRPALNRHLKKASDSFGSSDDDWKKVWSVPTAHETSIGKTDIHLPSSLPPPRAPSKDNSNRHLKKGFVSEQESQEQWKKWQGQWQRWFELEKQTKKQRKIDSKLQKNNSQTKRSNLSPRSYHHQEQHEKLDQRCVSLAADVESRIDGQSQNSSIDVSPTTSPAPAPAHSSTQVLQLSRDEISSLWKLIHFSLLRLIELGYDRSLLFAILPYAEKRIFHSSFKYLAQRFAKRVSLPWQEDEPFEVVQLCQSVLNAYEKLCSQSLISIPNSCY